MVFIQRISVRLQALNLDVRVLTALACPVSTKVEVGSINDGQLRKLDGELKTFEAQDKAPMSKRGFSLSPEEARSKLDRNTIAEYMLNLKAGAQVMLIKNLPDFGLVNGS